MDSLVVVNAASKLEGESFIRKITPLIKSDLLKGAELHSGGERKDAIKQANVTPLSAKYFSTGQKDMLPDWRYNFKTKLFYNYSRDET